MKTYRFWWDAENIEHIAEHNVEPAETEAAMINAKLIRKAGQGKYVAYGQTDGGRYLLVIFAHKDIRLRTDFLKALETLADRRGIPYQRLIQTWLTEKLAQEAPDLLTHA